LLARGLKEFAIEVQACCYIELYEALLRGISPQRKIAATNFQFSTKKNTTLKKALITGITGQDGS
jgi:hypothetical protein